MSFKAESSPGNCAAAGDSRVWRLALGATGVVFGDIGTNGIFTLREALKGLGSTGAPTRGDVLGILSLILWALLLIPTLKYVGLLLKADNQGEGGTFALMTLARRIIYRDTRIFLFLAMFGAGMFYGDALVTPAISVLAAVEGLTIAAPGFAPFVLPVTLSIIVALFLIQSRGTHAVSALFGPVMAVWFVVIAAAGLRHLAYDPALLAAFNPLLGLSFLSQHGKAGFFTLGAVSLSVAGAEALYADLGHFGRRPIGLSWLWFVLPSLAANYLGQGALVLHDPASLDNPFFRMVPPVCVVPLVVLATLATIIASQAVITGAYSLTRQAVNLGFLPRMAIRHTSADTEGQIYMPGVNYLLMLGVIVLVLFFRSSDNLASAYGLTVTGTMVVTTVMAFFVFLWVWEWRLSSALLVLAPFLVVDIALFSANLVKIFEGAWVMLAAAAAMIAIMLTWTQGKMLLEGRARRRAPTLERFLHELPLRHPALTRVAGCAAYLTPSPDRTPPALVQNLRHNRMLHEMNLVLSVRIEPVPTVPAEDRAIIASADPRFTTVLLRFGFAETPRVYAELVRLNAAQERGLRFDPEELSFFLSHRSLHFRAGYGLPFWQSMLYIWLNLYSMDPTDYFHLPMRHVVEIGTHAGI